MWTVEVQLWLIKDQWAAKILLTGATGHSCNILVMKLSVFSWCHESISGNEFKSNGLIPLTEETSREHNIDSVVCLLLFTLCMSTMKEIQKVKFKEKSGIRNVNIIVKEYVDKDNIIVKEIKAIK